MNRKIKIITIFASIFAIFGSVATAYVFSHKQTAQEFVTENEDFSKYDSQIMQFSDEFKSDFQNGTDDYRNSTIASIVSSWSISQLQLELSYNMSLRITNLDNQLPDFFLNKFSYDNYDYNKNLKFTVVNIDRTSTTDGTTYSYSELFDSAYNKKAYASVPSMFRKSAFFQVNNATVRIPDVQTQQIDGVCVNCQYCFFSGWETNDFALEDSPYFLSHYVFPAWTKAEQLNDSFEIFTIKHSFLLQNLFN